MYRGHDTQRERLVAVKLFKLDLLPDQVHQLVAGLERIVASNLAHRSIATPVAAGLTGSSAYLACDYIAADSLDLAVREFGALPPADALQVGARLASALDHAFAAGMTHGCLHPRDILMSGHETRLTGIGVGQLLAEIGIAPPVRRPYSAPERLGGSAWDRRADIFSLAALVHELLWGRRISGIGAKAVEGMTALDGGDLDALKRVFKRALAADPMERHPTAKIFVDALKRALPDVAAEALALSDPTPQPAARNLRLAMPARPPKDDAAPLLPLEPPRFADVDSVPDLPMTNSGPSIIESASDLADVKPETDAATQEAIDRFAMSWMDREADSPKVEAPFEFPTFTQADLSAPADIPLQPIVIPDREVIPDPEIIPERVATPEPAAVPEAVVASEAASVPEVLPAPEVVPAPEIESVQRVEPAPEVMPAPKPAPTPEPPPPAPAPSRRLSRTGPRSKSTNTLIGDATPLPIPAAALSDTTSRDESATEKREVADALPLPSSDLTMLDRSRSAVWPLVLALAVGVTLGFAGGYAVGVRSQPATVAANDASAAPATPLREFTEAAVPAAPKPATPPDAAPDPAAAAGRPEIVSRPVEPPPANVTSERVTRAPEPAAARTPSPPVEPRRPAAAPAASAPAAWTAGRLNIRSTPPGAKVSVDDRFVGQTPTSVRDLREGPHSVRITRDGYAVHDRRVVITRERSVQLINATLARQAPPAGRGAPVPARSPAPAAPAAATGTGMLSVESRPSGANVVLDGKVIGTTPLTTQSVPTGTHAIRLELDGYRIWAGAVRITANEQARVRASLER